VGARGDIEGFASRGVLVNFVVERERVRFEVNLGAAQRGGFRLSSKLLKLARLVEATP
jgi:YfiR/HmsC-like